MKILEVDPPVCPACGNLFGKLVSNGADEIKVLDTCTVCAKCLAYLRVVSLEDRKMTLKEMTSDELVALPSEEFLKLTRIRKLMARVLELMPPNYVEYMEKMKGITDEVVPQLLHDLSEKINEAFGKQMGILLILRDPKAQGYQMHMSNMPEKMVDAVLEVAQRGDNTLAVKVGEGDEFPERVKELLSDLLK
jgi:hypothetical protein